MPKTAERQGSRMSDRQLARAATSGRHLIFHFLHGEPLTGYLVGSDDFHWLVAHHEGSQYQVTLVHKASSPRITISPSPTLANQDADYQAFVRQIGAGFWSFCDQTYFGKTPPKSTSKPRQEPAA